MKIYIIRHGQTELNKANLINGHIDDTLTPEGMEQARVATLGLPNSLKRIYCSSLGRAKQTAEIINEQLGLDLTFHDELKEVNFGDLQGTPYLEQYKKRHMALDYDWRPTGECVEDVKKRVLNILQRISLENKDGEALVVAHGGIIRMLHFLEFNTLMGEIENASTHSFDLGVILKHDS
jgi:broad specificity phosphatase PhoE